MRRSGFFLASCRRGVTGAVSRSPRIVARRIATVTASDVSVPLLCSPLVFNSQCAGYSAIAVRTMSTNNGACAVPPKEKYERLPNYAHPLHYAIRLEPDFTSFKFKGHVDIDVDIVEATDTLKVHANALMVKSVSLKLANNQVFANLPHSYSEKANMIEIKLPVQVVPQKTVLSIDFEGVHNDKMQGFYRSKYTDNGHEKWMLSTQFESTYARQAFPCWDEPVYKATYDVTLVVDDGLTALSNAQVISESVEEKKRIVRFATTPKMSTYLVAFAVGNFEYIEEKCKNSGVVVRVYTVPGKKQLGSFGLEVATKAIDWYNEWFGIAYPLPKCDLIAIPDFSMGAMENWGLITFREVALLFDSEKTSTKQKAYVALVIAHELAHLWFGDLVTMKWWTDLWLKEGFASFMEYLFVGYNYPEMKIWLHFLNDELGSGFKLDALKSSHPIEVNIDNPNELDEIYDSITYAKSNSINRMLCFYLGEPTFQKGLRAYLKKFAYGNAETRDLWAALTDASGEDVASLMAGWTGQMGFPLISVSEVKREQNKRTLLFEQKRFIADGSEDSTDSLWRVPITLANGLSPDDIFHRCVITEKRQEITVEVPEGAWIKVNSGTTGFYRVRYSDEMLAPLIEAVSTGKLPVLDRFGLSNDIFALVSANQVPVSQFLNLVEASRRETEYAVWRTLDLGLGQLADVLTYADSNGALRKRFDLYVCEILSGVGDRIGWTCSEGEDGQVSLLRGLIQGRLCKSGHEPSIQKAKELFHAYIDSGKPLHADLRLSVFGAAIRAGGEKEFDSLRRHYESCGFPEIERHALVALGQADPKSGHLKKFFDYAVAEGKVRSQDLYQIFVGPSLSREGQEFAWQYFRDHTNVLIDKFGGVSNSLFQHCFKLSVQDSALESSAQEVDSFFCSKLDATALATLDRPIKQVAENIRNHAKLLAFAHPQVDSYLKEKTL